MTIKERLWKCIKIFLKTFLNIKNKDKLNIEKGTGKFIKVPCS